MKKTITIISLVVLLLISAVGISGPKEEHEYTNLKVLPKDISEEQLSMVMDAFKVSLGVKCSFCHALAADSSQGKHLDFASDAKEEKSRAREMMQMTHYLNATYFNEAHSTQPDTIHEVMCYTCHRGKPEPDFKALFPMVDSLMQLQHKK